MLRSTERTLNDQKYIKNKMTHNDMIIIVVTLSLALPLGVIVSVKLIKQYTRAPVNTLVRPGDIELGDYIQPIRPQQIYTYPDLLGHEYSRVPSILDGNTPSLLSGPPPSYYPQSILSGPAPSYHSIDRYYIHNNLENSINLDSILWLILIFIFTKQIYNNFHYSLLFLKFNNFHYSFILLL